MKIFSSLNLFVLAAGLFFAGCSPNSSGEFQGYIEGEYVYVAAPLGGALTNLAVARGDTVKTGQLLFDTGTRVRSRRARPGGKKSGAGKSQLGAF